MRFLRTKTDFEAGIGAVSSGSREATLVGIDILSNGGNAADAATACAFSLMITDPANASPAGRCQIIYGSRSSEPRAIDGTTVAPRFFYAEKGHKPIPIPGAVSALIAFQRKNGQLPLSTIIDPVLQIARKGFVVGREQAALWSWREPELRGTVLENVFLPKGYAPKQGETFVNYGLFQFFKTLKKIRGDPFKNPQFAASLLRRMQDKGISWNLAETLINQTQEGQVIMRNFNEFKVWTVGKQGWGHTMLDILDNYFKCSWEGVPAKELKLAFSTALSLLRRLEAEKGNSEEFYWSNIETAKILRQKISINILTELIEAYESKHLQTLETEQDRDTTALAVCDSSGNLVSITQSIGPHFGSRIMDEETGIVFAHSYQMAENFIPLRRDVTELCPSIVEIGLKMFAMGAAGSERIPGAVAAVISHLVGGKSLEEAVNEPRVNFTKTLLRAHNDLRPFFVKYDIKMPLKIEFSDRGPINHLGIIHAVGHSSEGSFEAAADPAYSGLGQVFG